MIRKAHFIGIAGVGMSATAKLLKDTGVAVTGSDQDVYPPISDFLQAEDISYQTTYAADHIPDDADLIVIGKNAKLVPETNPEVARAYASGKRVASFPEVLGELSKGKETVVVAGSVGKSTSAALLAHCLDSPSGGPHRVHDASHFIGAIPVTPATSARIGKGPLFVLEGDEYPSSNTDVRSKFLHYHPQHLLITPLAHDHINIFPTFDSYLNPFLDLVALSPARATIVACAEGPLSKTFLSRVTRPVVTYGVHDGDFHVHNIVWGEETQFTLVHKNTVMTTIRTTQLGEHNIQNIVGVTAFLFSRRLLSLEQIACAVGTFKGIKRRLDKKSDKTTIPIFEGFGSSYDKARSAIAAMKRHFPDRRLIILFEPHSFSWRNRDTLSWYDDVFDGAARVFIYEPPSQGATTHAQISLADIVHRVSDAGFDVEAITDADDAARRIGMELHSGDMVLLLTSGNLGGLIQHIPLIAERKFPKLISGSLADAG